jgi:hypothetical protein
MMMERGRDVHMYALRSVVYLSRLGRLLGYAPNLAMCYNWCASGRENVFEAGPLRRDGGWPFTKSVWPGGMPISRLPFIQDAPATTCNNR